MSWALPHEEEHIGDAGLAVGLPGEPSLPAETLPLFLEAPPMVSCHRSSSQSLQLWQCYGDLRSEQGDTVSSPTPSSSPLLSVQGELWKSPRFLPEVLEMAINNMLCTSLGTEEAEGYKVIHSSGKMSIPFSTQFCCELVEQIIKSSPVLSMSW